MSSSISVQTITDQLIHIERQIAALRQELGHRDLGYEATSMPNKVSQMRVDKESLKQHVHELFQILDIHGCATGVEKLQAQMKQAGLAPDELSRSIIEAREE